nr:hypothetical protein [Tanacetum cinerariifolium]
MTSGTLSFTYLGMPIGSNMNLIANWESLIDRFHGKFSSSKASFCPLEGGSGDRKKMTWVKWGNVMASIDKGSLGVKSLKAFNLVLLQKLMWRLVNNSDILWDYVIKAIHGIDAGMDGKGAKPKVGCGSSTHFWMDDWVGNGLLHLRYNILFHLDSNPKCVIRDNLRVLLGRGIGLDKDYGAHVTTAT